MSAPSDWLAHPSFQARCGALADQLRQGDSACYDTLCAAGRFARQSQNSAPDAMLISNALFPLMLKTASGEPFCVIRSQVTLHAFEWVVQQYNQQHHTDSSAKFGLQTLSCILGAPSHRVRGRGNAPER